MEVRQYEALDLIFFKVCSDLAFFNVAIPNDDRWMIFLVRWYKGWTENLSSHLAFFHKNNILCICFSRRDVFVMLDIDHTFALNLADEANVTHDFTLATFLSIQLRSCQPHRMVSPASQTSWAAAMQPVVGTPSACDADGRNVTPGMEHISVLFF